MISDCDERTSKLIIAEVQRELERQYGPISEMVIIEIRHEEDQVIVMGEFAPTPGSMEKRFAMTMPRVDGPLDYFL